MTETDNQPELLQIDAFTDRAFTGNPAAVCFLGDDLPDDTLQAIAAEMNLSETAFPRPRGDGGWDLRWFTPACEVKLCGHATLATAWALWETQRLPADEPAKFQTRSGLLTATRDPRGWVTLDFPVDELTPCDAPAGLVETLGRPEVVATAQGAGGDTLLELPDQSAVANVRPDFRALRELQTVERGLIVTAAADDPAVDFVSRFFAPGAGIDEDPVTGSAHCTLTPYWARKLGTTDLVARQISTRGGDLRTRLQGSRVEIRGQAVTVLRGRLVI